MTDSDAMSDKEIDVLTTHLPHELTMLQYSLEQVNNSRRDATANEEDPRVIMAFECFWLHARNLIEFFDTNATNANVVSPHIFTRDKLDYGVASEAMMRRINEQVAHLQRDRGISAEAPLTGKDMIDVKERIDVAVNLFQANLKQKAAEWWTHKTPSSVEYTQDFAATACTEIHMTELEAQRPTSSIFSFETGPSVTVTVHRE